MSSSRNTKNEAAVDELGALLAGATANRGGVAAPAAPASTGAPALPDQGSGETAPAVREELPPEVVRTRRLKQLEQTIEQSATTFRRAQARHYREVGPALEEIRDNELYLDDGYASWLDYLARRWEYSESHAYRFIDMGNVCRALAPLGDKALELLTAESHARELLPALKHGEEAVVRTWSQVTADPGQKITAARIAATRDALGYGKVKRNSGGEDQADAEQHKAAERSNTELGAIADDLERLGRRLDRVVNEGAAPLDQGKAITDVHRIRKAGRRFNKVAAVPAGPTRDADPGEDEADIVDAELVEDQADTEG